MKIKRICKECGKEFEVVPSRVKKGGGIFCSKKCKDCAFSKSNTGENNPHWKGGKIERICEICGKSFSVDPNQIKSGNGKYCSRKCQSIAHSKKPRGEKHPSWKGGQIKRKCGICGKLFSVKQSQIKIGGGKYCSKKCSGIAHSKLHKGKNAHNWKGGLVEGKCQDCGRIFHTKPSEIKNGNGRYCSLSCARKHQKIPTHYTTPERIFEGICKRNNLPFYYVGDGQSWVGKKGKGQLNPDFIEANGKKICVEIFGDYWHSPLLNRKMKEHGTLDYRKSHYRRYKWHPVFIWESDLKREDAEAFVLNELSKHM